jgi:hypothetical protein
MSLITYDSAARALVSRRHAYHDASARELFERVVDDPGCLVCPKWRALGKTPADRNDIGRVVDVGNDGVESIDPAPLVAIAQVHDYLGIWADAGYDLNVEH